MGTTRYWDISRRPPILAATDFATTRPFTHCTNSFNKALLGRSTSKLHYELLGSYLDIKSTTRGHWHSYLKAMTSLMYLINSGERNGCLSCKPCEISPMHCDVESDDAASLFHHSFPRPLFPPPTRPPQQARCMPTTCLQSSIRDVYLHRSGGFQRSMSRISPR